MKLSSLGDHSSSKFKLRYYLLTDYLRLDVAALKALNVFPSSSQTEVNEV
jgi:hypothetical protein